MFRRLIRALLAVVVGVTVLLATFAAVLLIYPGLMREPIDQALSGALGVEISTQGDVAVALLPVPGLVLDDVTVVLPEDDDLSGRLTARRLAATIDLAAFEDGTLRLPTIAAESVEGDLFLDTSGDAAGDEEISDPTRLELPAVALDIERVTLSRPDREPIVLEAMQGQLVLSAADSSGPLMNETLILKITASAPRFVPMGPDRTVLLDAAVTLDYAAPEPAAVTVKARVGTPVMARPIPVDVSGTAAGLFDEGDIRLEGSGTVNGAQGDFTVHLPPGEQLIGTLSLDAPGRDLLDLVFGSPGPLPLRALTTSLERTGTAIALKKVTARLDAGVIEGSGTVDTGPAKPVVDLVFEAETLDFSALFPERQGSATAAPLIPDVAVPTTALPISGRMTGTATTLLLGSVGRLDAFDATVSIAGSRIEVTEARAQRRGGQVALKGDVDFAGDAPAVTLSLDGDGLPVADLVTPSRRLDLRDSRLDVDAALSGRGTDLRGLVAASTGTITTAMTGGTVRLGLVGAGGQNIFARFLRRQDTTRLNCVYAPWTLKDGVAHSGGMILDTDDFRVAGRGSIDLLRERLSLNAAVEPRADALLASATAFRVEGPLGNPSVTPEPLGALTAVVNTAGATVNPLGILAAFGSGGSSTRGAGACRTAVQEGARSSSIPTRLLPSITGPATDVMKEGAGVIRGVGRKIRSIFD